MDNIENKQVTRRRFMRNSAITAATLGSVLAGCKVRKKEKEPNSVEPEEPNIVEPEVSKIPKKKEYLWMPKRKLGKTGVMVPVLALGTMFPLTDNQIVLRKTLELGVNYWDTANVYAGGNSELGIGQYLSNNPEVRKHLFLVTKALGADTQEGMEKCLQLSLSRMQTDYVDLHYFHALKDPAQLTDGIRNYAESAKKRGLIRFFGFSTHANMDRCLAAAAKLDWIDVIMTSYNFRVMQNPNLLDAIEQCRKANIGIIAMKTTGKTTIPKFQQPIETEMDKKMIEHFLQQGFTPEQACIKFALQNKNISSACVQMDSIAVLNSNVAAVRNKTELTQADEEILKEYARATCDGYCAGCANICNSALPDTPYVSDIMRYLMYYNSYGDKNRARELFAQIPAGVRNRLLTTDYRLAQARCPQHLPISKLIAEAVSKLA
jgi:predicted aldo/keto reductase-like oxidoreductase